MILSRRKAHLFSSITLAVLLPLLFVLGLLLRPNYSPINTDVEALFSSADSPQITANQTELTVQGSNPIAAFLAK